LADQTTSFRTKGGTSMKSVPGMGIPRDSAGKAKIYSDFPIKKFPHPVIQ